ncbi:MAG: type II toxin-antitoxin system VapB family antitoxin [Candidatus Firestonebacteria bacterium]
MGITNIVIDDRLLKIGLNITGFNTKKKLINFALEELVKRKNRKDIISLKGVNCWKGDLEEMRRSRH